MACLNLHSPSASHTLTFSDPAHLGAVHEVPAIAMTNDTAVLDVELVALVLDLIQDTVGYISHRLAYIQAVGSQDGEFLSGGATAVRELLV